jgi:hypothetical protein
LANWCVTGSGQTQEAGNREVRFALKNGLHQVGLSGPKGANFSREPPFLLLGLSYMRDLPPERADSHQERIGGVMVAAVS